MVAVQHHECTKCLWIVHFKAVNFMLHELDLCKKRQSWVRVSSEDQCSAVLPVCEAEMPKTCWGVPASPAPGEQAFREAGAGGSLKHSILLKTKTASLSIWWAYWCSYYFWNSPKSCLANFLLTTTWYTIRKIQRCLSIHRKGGSQSDPQERDNACTCTERDRVLAASGCTWNPSQAALSSEPHAQQQVVAT